MIHTIAVAGAGTMGSGIALAAALQHYPVTLFDTNAATLLQAEQLISKNVQYLVNKQSLTEATASTVRNNITYTTQLSQCVADVIIEAIVEKLAIKKALYQSLANINTEHTIIASNTSSLSITDIQSQIPHPNRVCGMHFFNPAHIMKLVEVVAGRHTDAATIKSIEQLCIALKKQPVLCKDAPGFIVNRVARHFYLEAMQMASTQGTPIKDIDVLMENAGFKMGPFALMDLIGLDVNYAVSQSIYKAFSEHPRFSPSPMQAEKVAQGLLGKKTGEGFYRYVNNEAQ